MAKQPARKSYNAERQLDLTLAQLDRLANYYPRVEAKAVFMLAFNAGLVALAVSNVDVSGGVYKNGTHGLLIIFSVLVAISYFELAITLIPHLRSPIQKSHTYFGDVASDDCENFISWWKDLSTEDRILDATIQVWRNSQILTSKYRACDRAIKLAMLALIPWLALLAGPFLENQLKLL